MTLGTRPGFPLDDVVAACGRLGASDVSELLAQMSHIDPNDNPLTHALLWSQILAADIAADEHTNRKP